MQYVGFCFSLCSVCGAVFPRVLRSLFARVAASKEYSIFYVQRDDSLYCFVRTWDDVCLQDVCVRVEAIGQQVPYAELSCMSRIVDSLASCQWPLAIKSGSPSLQRVLNDNRVDGRRFIVCREFTKEVFLQCYREAHQEVFRMLEMTSTVDFLMLRLRGALQEPWMEDVVELRRSVIAGRVPFADLCGVVADLISVWNSVSRCRRFIDALVDVILSQLLVSSEFLQGVYRFCPELPLEGDDHCVFSLFSRLVRVLEWSGALSSVESKPAVEEFTIYVADVRARHLASRSQVEDID